MGHESVERFVILAERGNLDSLRAEIGSILEDFPENERPHVATNLERALDMFLDAYKRSKSGASPTSQ